jgi:trehalose-6-phosphate synthase
LDSERRSKRKKVDTKIKQLLQEKAKSEESYEKMGVSLYDRIKNMEKKLRAFEEKLLEMPSGKIVVG